MLDMSKLDFDIDTLNAEVAELQRVEGVKETEQELNTQAQARIDAYFLNNRRLIRWGFDSLVYKPVRVNTSNELLTCLTNYQLDGNGQLSGNFLIGAYYVLESRLHSCKVKVNGLVRTNLDKLRH